MLYLVVTGFVSVLLFAWLKERVLYLIFVWSYVQNFILAWMYTSGLVEKDLCQALLILKEFLLLWLFLYFLPAIKRGGGWPRPLRILVFFTLWCAIRYFLAVILQGASFFGNLFNLRLVFFPLQILTVAVGVAQAKPQFAKRFIRQMTYCVGALALAGILFYLPSYTISWSDHVDFARYSAEVKGESHETDTAEIGDVLAASEGVVGNGIAREEFSFLSPFRAIGTIGDAVGFGHFVAFPILLLLFCFPRNWKTRFFVSASLGALFVSFTRSAWIFVLGGAAFILLRKKRYRLVLSIVAVPVIALTLWAPMGEWFSSSVAMGSSGTPDEHVSGIMWFFQEGISDLRYFFGQDIEVSRPLPESGYAILLIRYGVPAVLMIVWFCFALYQDLSRTSFREKSLLLVAQAVPLAMLVTMSFSAYPFSFIPYLLTWFVVGTCLVFATKRTASPIDDEKIFDLAFDKEA